MKSLFIILIFMIAPFFSGEGLFAQDKKYQEYQIHLNKPAKTIKHLLYEKNFVPIQGKLSEDKKSIIIKNYEMGSKVRVKVEYEDGTTDEFVRSPCFIDPVIVSNEKQFHSFYSI